MEQSLAKETESVNAVIRRGVDYMVNLGVSRVCLARAVGYTITVDENGNERCAMIDRMMSELQLPGFMAGMKLAKIFSEHGFDELSDLFSADGKFAIPFDWEIDGDLSNEMTEIMTAAGMGRDAFDRNARHEALPLAERLVRAAVGYRTEHYNRFQPETGFDPCQTRML